VHIPPGDSPHEMPPGLAPFQVEVARLLFALRASHGFLLAGGAALLAQRLTDGPTRDLDFFTAPGRGDLPAAGAAFEAAARDRGWRIETLQSGATFVRLLIGRRDEQLLVDLAVDAPPGRPATITIVGPSYDPAELAGRKVIVKGRGASVSVSDAVEGGECGGVGGGEGVEVFLGGGDGLVAESFAYDL
jgi:hypothetical protein